MRPRLHLQKDQKNVLCRYMEDFVYKLFHDLPRFVINWNSRTKFSIDMKPEEVGITNFLSILYSKLQREKRKPKHKTEAKLQISKYNSHSQMCYKWQITQQIIKNVAIATKRPLTYAKKMIRVGVYEAIFIKKS